MATTPYIFGGGDYPTAPRLNTHSSAITELQNPPAFLAVQNAAQSIPNNVNTTVLFQVETRDTDAGYNPATGIYTVATAGLWVFTSNIGYASNATGLRQGTLIATNYQSAMEVLASTDAVGRCVTTFIGAMAVADTVSVLALQTSGGALNTAGTSARCNFAGYRIGP